VQAKNALDANVCLLYEQTKKMIGDTPTQFEFASSGLVFPSNRVDTETIGSAECSNKAGTKNVKKFVGGAVPERGGIPNSVDVRAPKEIHNPKNVPSQASTNPPPPPPPPPPTQQDPNPATGNSSAAGSKEKKNKQGGHGGGGGGGGVGGGGSKSGKDIAGLAASLKMGRNVTTTPPPPAAAAAAATDHNDNISQSTSKNKGRNKSKPIDIDLGTPEAPADRKKDRTIGDGSDVGDGKTSDLTKAKEKHGTGRRNHKKAGGIGGTSESLNKGH
jgi:hypothetical protein